MLKVEIPRGHLLLFKKDNLRKALRESAKLVAQEARSLTRNAGGSGRAYPTPSTMSKGVHYASAPGEPPASLTGKLSSSIRYSVKGNTARVFDNAFYSLFLEVGAQGGAGNSVKGGKGKRNPKAKKSQPNAKPSTRRVLLPRPFLTRALTDHEKDIEQKIIAAVEADLKFGK